MDNGVSKKLCVVTTCISGIVGLAANAENKLPYALIVAGMFIAYLIARVIKDWKKDAKKNEEG